MHHDLVVDHRSGMTIVQFSRPEKRNALTRDMLARLPELLRGEVNAHGTPIILTGGTDNFSAGMDLAEIGRGADDAQVDDLIARAAMEITGLQVPVIAAIEGACIGAAFEIALSCDLRVVSRTAFFQVPAARLGVLYRPDGIANLVARVGRETMMRLFVFGERIAGATADTSGIASHIVDAGSTLDRAVSLARTAAECEAAAVALTKELIVEASMAYTELSRFEDRRRALLLSENRRRLVADARGKLGEVRAPSDRRTDTSDRHESTCVGESEDVDPWSNPHTGSRGPEPGNADPQLR